MDLISETDPRLKLMSEDYDFQSTTLEERAALVQQMFDVMTENHGIGLAAPQIGINRRVFVMEVEGSRFPCFNPQIIEVLEETEKAQEGCLSFPGLRMHVTRHSCIIGKFADVHGNEVTRQFKGLAARCFQHELDHLNGVTFDSKVSKMALELAKKRRPKQRNK